MLNRQLKTLYSEIGTLVQKINRWLGLQRSLKQPIGYDLCSQASQFHAIFRRSVDSSNVLRLTISVTPSVCLS